MTNKTNSNSQRRGATAAGLGGLALASVLLLCGAGNAPIENFTPQGAMQADLNAGGHSVTNVATVSATNVSTAGLTATGASIGTLSATNMTVSGGLTATNFTLPFSGVTAKPTTVAGYGITDAETQAAAIATGVAAPTRVLCIGDSITSGGPAYGGSGIQTSYPAQLSNLSFCRDSQVFCLGEPGQNANTINTNYAGTNITTTVTTTAGSTAATLGSAASVVTGDGIGASSLPINTTLTLGSGTAITLSSAATMTGTVACSISAPGAFTYTYLAGPLRGYNAPNSTGVATTLANLTYTTTITPHMVSPAVMGGSAIAILYLFTNDEVELGTTNETGNLTSGSNIISGIPSTSGWAVGNYLSATAGIPYGATITSIDSSSQIHMSANATVTVAATALATAVPAVVTASETSATALVNRCVADGDSVLICTTFPNYNTPQSFCGNFRQLFDNYLYATYGGAAFGGSSVTGVTLYDLGTAPEFRSSFANHLNYFQPSGLHPSDAGYTVMANDINAELCAVFPVVSHANITGQVVDGQLSGDVPYGVNGVYSFFSNNTSASGGLVFNDYCSNPAGGYRPLQLFDPNMATGSICEFDFGAGANGNSGAHFQFQNNSSGGNYSLLYFGIIGGYSARLDYNSDLATHGSIGTSTGFQDSSGGTHVSAPVVFDASGNLVPLALNSTAAASVATTVGQSYQPTGGAAQAFLLPATAAVGQTVSVTGTGAGGWTVTQNAGQAVRWNGAATTAGTGGYVQSATADSCVTLTCTVANTTWTVTAHEGSITLH